MSQVQSNLAVAAAPGCVEAIMPVEPGVELFYRGWLGAPTARQAVFLFHRGHEHSGRLAHVAEALRGDDRHVFAWDARGHGRSPGRRGFADSFSAMARDMDRFVRGVCRQYDIPMQNIAIVAHSVGAVVAAAWVHDYAPPIRGMVLVTPAFRVKLYIPLAVPALRVLRMFKRDAVIKSYVKAKMLTHDPAMAASYASDPLISRDISNHILLDMHDAATRIMDDAATIHAPTLMLSAGSDWVVKPGAQRRFFARLGSAEKRAEAFPGMFHALLHEQDRVKPIASIRQFVDQAFARPASDDHATLRSGDPATRVEHEELSRPLSIFSPKRWVFTAARAWLGTICRLSEGVRIGWRTGFDSGPSLDHVYKNRAAGITPLGKLIDRFYLDSIGWRGIRIRKQHIDARLRWCIQQHLDAGRPARILDIASGPGRYVLDVLGTMRDKPVSAVLRDRDPVGLEVGRELAKAMNLQSATHEIGDAFDPASITSASPRPNIAIVSGLYELFADNDLICRSLGGLAAALEPGGYLIYTNQPWHPQIEFIARVLINRDHQPWIMRRRSQAEIDSLVASAGFEKIEMDIDPFGIFTVSLARKR